MTDPLNQTECSGGPHVAKRGQYGVPYCRRNTGGCPFHYPDEYKGTHRGEPTYLMFLEDRSFEPRHRRDES